MAIKHSAKVKAEIVDAFDQAAPQSQDKLDALVVQAAELTELELTIKEVEQSLKVMSGRANELKTQVIPDAMAQAGVSEFRLPDGTRIKVEDFVAGSLPKDPEKRAGAIEWLEDHGLDAIIKNKLELTFGKGEHNVAQDIANWIRQNHGYDAEVVPGVHPQTYLAAIREKLKGGEEVNAELLGVFIGRKAKVELGK